MGVTSLEVPSRSGLEKRARLETRGWCLPLEPVWREAAQVSQKPRLQLHPAALSLSEVSLSSTPTSGSACEFLVNTSKAGPGALAVTIDGPSKVKMDCVECPEGYRVTYMPMAPGSYLISIKYGGPYHIVGSPFKARISGESSRSAAGDQHKHDLHTTLSSRSKACVQPQLP